MDTRKLFIVLIVTLFAATGLLINGLQNTDTVTNMDTYWNVQKTEVIREKTVKD